jgi:hypothetical protein
MHRCWTPAALQPATSCVRSRGAGCGGGHGEPTWANTLLWRGGVCRTTAPLDARRLSSAQSRTARPHPTSGGVMSGRGSAVALASGSCSVGTTQLGAPRVDGVDLPADRRLTGGLVRGACCDQSSLHIFSKLEHCRGSSQTCMLRTVDHLRGFVMYLHVVKPMYASVCRLHQQLSDRKHRGCTLRWQTLRREQFCWCTTVCKASSVCLIMSGTCPQPASLQSSRRACFSCARQPASRSVLYVTKAVDHQVLRSSLRRQSAAVGGGRDAEVARSYSSSACGCSSDCLAGDRPSLAAWLTRVAAGTASAAPTPP